MNALHNQIRPVFIFSLILYFLVNCYLDIGAFCWIFSFPFDLAFTDHNLTFFHNFFDFWNSWNYFLFKYKTILVLKIVEFKIINTKSKSFHTVKTIKQSLKAYEKNLWFQGGTQEESQSYSFELKFLFFLFCFTGKNEAFLLVGFTRIYSLVLGPFC